MHGGFTITHRHATPRARQWARQIALYTTAALASGLATASHAQDAAAPPTMAPSDTAMSFEAAQIRAQSSSATLQAADHQSQAAEHSAAAVANLNRPIVSVSANYIAYQKTLNLDLSEQRQSVLDGTQDFLSGLPSTVPAEFTQIVTDITGRISAALPGLFGALPDTLSYQTRQDVFRPAVQAVLPIYSGGAFSAIRQGAEANVAATAARGRQARDVVQINLIRVYFGQLTAQALESSALETRIALDRLLHDAQRLEEGGFTPRSRTLEAQVARDSAERAYQRAILAHQTARMELAQALEMSGVRPSTPLFVDTRPLEPATSFLGNEDSDTQTQQARAAGQLASASVDLARSQYRPQAYAFGSYNFNRDNALPTDPDWVVGVGMRYTLISNVGRGQALAAARENVAAADDAVRAARTASTTSTLRAWDMVEAARRSFVLLGSNLAAAEESLRIQTVAFREGEGTLTTVLAAEAALASARTQRIATAYEYDLALAALLQSSGRLDSFTDHMARADVRLAPGGQP